MINNRKRGNYIYNHRIADLVMSGWSANQIWLHLVMDESHTLRQYPISESTIKRRVKLYRDNIADLQRLYNNEMMDNERDVFMRRMKLTKKG